MRFEVIQNDITNMSVDAIVLPANEKLKEGSGTSKAIFEKAGRKDLTKACSELRFCKTGCAIPTPAFHLDANYIIHAVVPKWIDGEHQEYDYLSAAYLSALNLADVLNCESIAFPLLAAGNNGFYLELAYEIARESIESFESSSLKQVFLVVYSDNIATFIKGKGVPVSEAQNPKILIIEVKKLAQEVLSEQIEKALVYLKDEKNREKIVQIGITIATQVLKHTPSKYTVPLKVLRHLKIKPK